MFKPTTALLATLALLPAAALAQSKEAICKQIAVLEPGHWVEFEMTGQPQFAGMRISHVGNEKHEGKTYSRYEMQMKSSMGTMVSQVLTTGRIFDMSEVREMVVQIPGQPTMRLSGEQLKMSAGMNRQPNVIADERCNEAEVVGRETVTVPAGSFRTLHIRTSDGDEAWVSADATGGIVKGMSKDGTTMVLAGQGTGAKATIQQ